MILTLTGILTVLTLAACGSDDDGGGGQSNATLIDLLAAVPDTPDAAQYVAFSDMQAYADALGVGPPPRGASADEFNDWLRGLSQAESPDMPLIGGSQFVLAAYRDPQAYRDEIGVDASRIDAALEAGVPPEMYTVVAGSFDDGDVGDAVRGDDNFSDLLEEESRGEVSYYTWGDDFEQDFARNSPVHTLGRGGRLALHEEMLFWCFWTDGMTGMIDAATGAADSLAGRADYAALADALSQLGAYTVVLTTQTQDAAEFGEGEQPLLAPYLSYAVAGARDQSGAYMTIAIANADEATAAENATRLQERVAAAQASDQPWATGIASLEADGQGTVTIAVLHGDDLPWDFISRNDPLLLHE